MSGINSLAGGLSALFRQAGATVNNVMASFRTSNQTAATPSQADTALRYMTSKIALDPDPPLYEQDVHRDLTTALAMAAGFNDVEADAIARGNQQCDELPSKKPTKIMNWEERRKYHFTTTERRTEIWRNFVNLAKQGNKRDALNELGVYLHAQQDSYSHDGYMSLHGHLLDGHAPDKTYNNPKLANRMAEDSYYRLVEAARILRKQGMLRDNRAPLAWNEVLAPEVNRFNTVRPAQPKRKPTDNAATNVGSGMPVRTGNDGRSVSRDIPSDSDRYKDYYQQKRMLIDKIKQLAGQPR